MAWSVEYVNNEWLHTGYGTGYKILYTWLANQLDNNAQQVDGPYDHNAPVYWYAANFYTPETLVSTSKATFASSLSSITGYCYGVVSCKASHSTTTIFWSTERPRLISNHSQFIHQTHLVPKRGKTWWEKAAEFCLQVSVSQCSVL
jgi:hypothetical protein